ncbi:MAG: T9SS type A sorting domain-containing protein, partial [Bacteroidota bacterium]
LENGVSSRLNSGSNPVYEATTPFQSSENNLSEITTNNLDERSIKLFPNPAHSNQLNLHYSSAENQKLVLSIFNSSGQLLQQRAQIVYKGTQLIPIDISNLSKGTYLVQTHDGAKVNTIKFVVP